MVRDTLAGAGKSGTAKRERRQALLAEAVRSFGTPSYVFDLDAFHARIGRIREILGNRAEICFAMKANPFLAAEASEKADHLEVCSPGEFRICEHTGAIMEKVVLSGVHKEKRDVDRIAEQYGGRITYTAESESQLGLLEEAARRAGCKLPVLLRVTSGNQFGMDEELIRRLLGRREAYPDLELIGLQYFSGTQKKRVRVLEEELQRLDALIRDLRLSCGFETKCLEFGPGLYVEYFPKQEKAEHAQVKGAAPEKGYQRGEGGPDRAAKTAENAPGTAGDAAAQEAKEDSLELMRSLSGLLEQMEYKGRIVLELGRYLAADCGCYLTSVADIKENCGTGYCIVDGGIHQVHYFGQTMAMKIPSYRQLGPDGKEKRPGPGCPEWNICGSLCTVNDLIVKKLPLQDVRVGDVLVFENTGAYSVTEGMALFLSRDLPQVLFWDRARGLRGIRERRETDALNAGALWRTGSRQNG